MSTYVSNSLHQINGSRSDLTEWGMRPDYEQETLNHCQYLLTISEGIAEMKEKELGIKL